MIEHVAVHVVHGVVGLLVRVEHHESIALALARLLVLDHVDAQDAAAVGEQRVQVGLVRLADAVHVDDVAIAVADRIEARLAEIHAVARIQQATAVGAACNLNVELIGVGCGGKRSV